MKFEAEIYEPMYVFNEKRYLRMKIPEKTRIIIEKMHAQKKHLLKNSHTDDPLEGSVLKVKVPYRYRRVTCKWEGRPLQSLIKGDVISVEVEFKGAWNVENHSGFSWVLSSSIFSSSSESA
jgi:hypothetical protein